MIAFRSAAAAGAEMIELDVQLSADRVPVVIHDATLDRTTGSRGPGARRTAAELAAIDAGFWFSSDRGRSFPFRGAGHGVPALDEVLSSFPETRFTLEIKTPDPALDEPLRSVLRSADAEERVLLASFNGTVLRRIRRSFEGFPTNFGRDEVAAFLRRGDTVPEGARALQVPPRHIWRRIVTRGFVSAAHAAGVEVHVWTVNAPAAMHRLLDMAVDGIMTDFPDRLLQTYRQRGLR